MKKKSSNISIRISGFFKRLARLKRVFFTQNKSAIKYTSLGTVSLAAVAVIVALLAGGTLGLESLIPDFSTPTPTASPTPVPQYSPTPVPHIYGASPLIVLDGSGLNDSGYIGQTAAYFGKQNFLEGEYIKAAPEDFLETYAQMAEQGNTPNVVIAPNDLLMQLGQFQDISSINQEVLFNGAAEQAQKSDRIPVALKMYGYFFRVDLLFAMSHEVPREYDGFEWLGKRLRSDFAYEYLRYTEENKLLSDRKDEFLTSRYGFGFPAADIGGQLFIEQAILRPYGDGTNVLHQLKTMWEEIYLPPDTPYATDGTIASAYINDALVGVFASGTLYETLLAAYPELYNNTQIKPHLSNDPVFAADAIYCAVPEGADAETAKNFLSMLYNGGNLDKLIAQNHTAYLPVSNFLNPESPWKDALNQGSRILFYENDDYIKVLKQILLASEDVDAALSTTKK